jgi:hypothetical protein
VGTLDVYASASADFSPAVGGPVTLTLPRLALTDFHGNAGGLGGTLSGTDNFVVTGQFDCYGGRLVGPVGSQLTAMGGIFVGLGSGTLDGRTLNNSGTTTLAAGGLDLRNGAIFNNLTGATLDLQNDNGMGVSLIGGSVPSLNNAGRITKSNGSGDAGLPAVNNTSTGTIDDQQGNLFIGQNSAASSFDGTVGTTTVFAAPGTLLSFGGREGTTTFSATSSIQGDRIGFDVGFQGVGTFVVGGSYSASTSSQLENAAVMFTGTVGSAGALTIQDNYSSADFSPAAGGPVLLTVPVLNLENGGRLSGSDNFWVTGPFTWRGAALVGPSGSSLTAAGGIIIGGGVYGDPALDGRTLDNIATATWIDGNVIFRNGASLANDIFATFDDQVDGSLLGGLVLTNSGTFIKSGGDGITTIQGQLVNKGMVRVERGQLTITGGYIQPAGSAGSASGTINAPATNDGQMLAGPSANPSPTFLGYTQSFSGVLTEQIGGYAPGTQYGQITVNGDVSLDGTLQVQLVNGFTPQLFDQFLVIDNQGPKSIQGAFAGLSEGSTVFAGFYGFAVSYAGSPNHQDLVLTVVKLPPVITSFTIPAVGSEGTTITLSAAAIDPGGSNDSLQYTWTVTQPDQSVVTRQGASVSFTPPDEGDYTARLTVVDSSGASTQMSGPIGVVDVAPTIALGGAPKVDQGANYTLTLGTVTEHGGETVRQYLVHWGDGTSDTYATAGGKTHVYATGATTDAITVDLVDGEDTYVNCGVPLSVYVNAPPTVAVPGAQTAFANVDKSFGGLLVGDPDGDNLTVTLAVSHGTLTLGTTTGLIVTGSGSGSVSLSGSIANLNAALAGLLYRGTLNYSGTDTLSITASDGSLSTNGSVAITIKSAVQQAADLQAQVNALHTAGVLNKGQTNTLIGDLTLNGNHGDIGKVQQFLLDVSRFLHSGYLTQAQADALSGPGNVLLLTVMRQ